MDAADLKDRLIPVFTNATDLKDRLIPSIHGVFQLGGSFLLLLGGLLLPLHLLRCFLVSCITYLLMLTAGPLTLLGRLTSMVPVTPRSAA